MRPALFALCLACVVGCASQSYRPLEPGWQGQVVGLTQAWPVSSYTVLDKGRPVGRMTLRQSIVEEHGERFVLLEDAARVVDPTGEAETADYTYISRCRLDDHLTPRVIEAQAPVREDTPTNSRVEIVAGRAVGDTFESTVDLPVPERFAIRQGLMRLVGLLPREVGTETELTFLSLGAEPRVEPGRSVRCSGREELELGRRRVMAWRFEYQSAESGSPRRISMWVGDDGRFLRFHDPEGLQLELLDV
jgi:hypothetical protein